MTKDEKLSQLAARGYRINVQHNGDSKYVTFTGEFSKDDHRVKSSYSSEFTDHEIRIDLVDRLLEWAGLAVVEVLQ